MSSWTPCQIFRRFREKLVKFMCQVRFSLDALKLINFISHNFQNICVNEQVCGLYTEMNCCLHCDLPKFEDLIDKFSYIFQLYPCLMMTRLDFHNNLFEKNVVMVV